MRMFGYGNLLATMSLSNPRLTRNIFSRIMNNRVDSSTKKVKNTLSDYDKKFAETYDKKSYDKKISDKKISDDAKKVLAAQLNQTPLYTEKSLLHAGYSTLGNFFNYLL